MQTKRHIWAFFAHAAIIIGMMLIAFFTMDLFQPAMQILTGALGKWLVLSLALVAVVNGIFSAKWLFLQQKRRMQKQGAQTHGHDRIMVHREKG